MNENILPLIAIAILFAFLLLIKNFTTRRFCVLCGAVSLTWIGLLILRELDYVDQPLVLGVLMGESVFGVYHLVEKKVPEAWHVFRLPFLLTVTSIALVVLSPSVPLGLLIIFLASLWIVTAVIFVQRDHGRLRTMAKRLIACCKDW